jgi:hypothetical protein
MSKKPLEIDMIAGSQLRDTQGEMLSVEGADISELELGNGRINDNHAKGFFNSLGRITEVKKIMKAEDCITDRHSYYWEKIKAPYIYAKAILYDDDDHPNAKAAAAILRNIHKADCPLKLKASVEGGVVARGIGDTNLLARTKIHSVALTFTPANNATLVEPLSLEKSNTWVQDENLIKSVMHLARTDIPSFRHITRRASAEKIVNNFDKIRNIAKEAGLKTQLPEYDADQLVRDAVMEKVSNNVNKINNLVKVLVKTVDSTGGPLYHIKKDGYQITSEPLSLRQINNTHGGVKKLEASGHVLVPHAEIKKALTAGYGGAGTAGSQTGGSVLQAESLDDGRGGLKYINCNSCGKEGIYMKHQVKCRSCGSHYPFADLYRVICNE